jgi:hypothetical protein
LPAGKQIFLQISEREICNLGFKVDIVLGHNVITINLKPALSFIAVSENFGRSA